MIFVKTNLEQWCRWNCDFRDNYTHKKKRAFSAISKEMMTWHMLLQNMGTYVYYVTKGSAVWLAPPPIPNLAMWDSIPEKKKFSQHFGGGRELTGCSMIHRGHKKYLLIRHDSLSIWDLIQYDMILLMDAIRTVLQTFSWRMQLGQFYKHSLHHSEWVRFYSAQLILHTKQLWEIQLSISHSLQLLGK